MHVRKAVITAAGRGAGHDPGADTVRRAMLPLVDRDGRTKPVLQIIAEEAADSGIEQIGIVTAPGDEDAYRARLRAAFEGYRKDAGHSPERQEQARHLADLERRLHFIVQPSAEGYGHAVWCAREFVDREPFLLLVSDHVYVSGGAKRCAAQILELASQEECAVAAVQATREHQIHRYGTVAGKRFSDRPNTFTIETVIEKPTVSVAEQRLHVPGLRVGHYLCFFGIHALTPGVFDILDEHVRADRRENGAIQLTPALQELASRERYLAVQANGRRYDLGAKFGVLEAQIALAMAGVDREHLLARMTELWLQLEQDRTTAPAVPDGGGAASGAAPA